MHESNPIELTTVEKLTLALIYLNSVEDEESSKLLRLGIIDEAALKAPKSYRFDVLDNLHRYGLIDEGKLKNKHVSILEDGLILAKNIVEKFENK